MTVMVEPLGAKYRPKTFEEVVGQESIVSVLKNQLDTNNLKNVYLFVGPAGTGKAQPLYSKVLTPHGFIPMGKVKVGTQVITGGGHIATVSGVYPQGLQPVYEITLQDRTKIRVSKDHLNVVWTRNSMGKRVDLCLTTQQLIELFNSKPQGPNHRIRIDTPTVELPYKEVEVDPYLLGCLIGDGSLSKGNFAFSNGERDIVQKVDRILRKDWGLCLRKVPGSNVDYNICAITPYKYVVMYRGVEYTRPQLCNKLVEEGYPRFDEQTLLNIADNNAPIILKKFPQLVGQITYVVNEVSSSSPNKLKQLIKEWGLDKCSKGKFIPKEYLYNSKEVRLQLLQGLFDTDGYTALSGITEFGTSSPQLSEDFAFLARSLGARDTISICDNTYYTKSSGERVYTDNKFFNHHIKFTNDLQYCTSKKHINRRKKRQNPPLRNIVSIKYVGEDVCQCIMVDHPEHTYISDDFIPTHNTTLSRILAKNLDDAFIVEIDAASYNSVTDARELVQQAKTQPITGKYRCYIIDEVHSLSTQAFQVLLKIFEEPPAKTIFILCTTDPQKIPKTILSRVQRFEFKKIKEKEIIERLKYVCKEEGITYKEEDLILIAKMAEGGMRDALTILDKVMSYSKDLSVDLILSITGHTSYDIMFELTNNVVKGNKKGIVKVVTELADSGKNLKQFVNEYLKFVVDLCSYQLTNNFEIISIPPFYKDKMIKEDLQPLLDTLLTLTVDIRYEDFPKYMILARLLCLNS